ncbi:MAG: aminotransferase class V-fold PLP-dependent enzyme [Acidobacteriota bacterium]
MSRSKLWIPGPTECAPEILEEMARPPIGHRGAEIQELVGAILPGLRTLLDAEEVGFMTASATTVMEAGLRNLVGRKALVLACGSFGKRWKSIADACGIEADLVSVDLGEAIKPAHVEEHLTDEHDAVCLTWSETSTGVLNPVADISAAVRAKSSDACVLVDGVSALAAAPGGLRSLDADLLLAGVQKALALPPGLAVHALSERALARAETIPHRGFVTDFLKLRDSLAKNQTPATPSVSHLFALRVQLERMAAEGPEGRVARHAEMAARVHGWAADRGLSILAEEGHRSPAVTSLSRDGLDPKAVISGVEERLGVRLGSGYGDRKPTDFRIGHMGEHDLAELESLLETIDSVS